jgi:hypothetical protein
MSPSSSRFDDVVPVGVGGGGVIKDTRSHSLP